MEDNKQPCEEEAAAGQSAVPIISEVSAGGGTGRRRTWPEVVGMTAEEAEIKIKEDMKRANVQVVPPNCFVTMDFRTDRVRLYIDSSGKVARPPMIG